MSYNKPDFDFSSYNPKDPWGFPAERQVLFGIEAMEVFQPSRNKYRLYYKYPDVRFTMFHNLIQLCHGAMSIGIFLRDESSRIEWWNTRPEFTKEYSPRMAQNFSMGLRGQYQKGFFNGIVHQIEYAIRQIATALDPEEMWVQGASFRKVWQHMLPETGATAYADLLRLLLVARDCMNFNGKHCPPTRKDLTISYKGIEYVFLNNEEIKVEDWGYLDEWDFLLFLLHESNQMLNLIIDSESVVACPLIMSRYMEERE